MSSELAPKPRRTVFRLYRNASSGLASDDVGVTSAMDAISHFDHLQRICSQDMSGIIDFLKTRRSVKPRNMTGNAPSESEIETILTIGARVPDHGKLAPWRFIIFQGDARARAGDIIADVYARRNPEAPADDVKRARESLSEAPLVIAVVSSPKTHPKVPPWEQQLSAGACAFNIVTAATALGYGANWLTGWFAYDRDVLTGLGLKAEEQLVGFIHIGGAEKNNEDRPRPALADIVTRF